MSKPENVLIIDPAQELKFRGEFEKKKKVSSAFGRCDTLLFEICNTHIYVHISALSG